MKQKSKTKKEIKVEKISNFGQKVKDAKTMAFIDYHGLSANDLGILREKIKETGGELVVEKNTLVKRALESHHLEAARDQLIGPTATVFSYEDEIAPIRELSASTKTLGFPKFKFGFFGKDYISEAALENLAKIPGKEALRGQLVGALVSPVWGIVSVLGANMRNLVSVLDQAKNQKASS